MGWFTWLMGKPVTPKELLRRNQRMVNKAIRSIERERYNLEKQEQKQIVEIKRVAQKHQQDVVRALANDLVRTRSHIKKLMKMKANLQGIALQLTTLQAQQNITQAVHHATLVLRGLNRQLNMPRIQSILKEFEKQNQIMEIKEEMVNESVDEVMGNEDDLEESDEIVSQILDELGLQLGEQLPETPQDAKSKASSSKKQAVSEVEVEQSVNSIDDELFARLERLRKE